MWVDIDRKQKQSDGSAKEVSVSSRLLPPGVCRLLLPSGRYQLVSVQDPGDYVKYTKAMQDWGRWVNMPPSERKNFYKDTVYDQDQLSSIQQELQKIRCFNFLVDNTVMNQVPGSSEKPGSQVGHTPAAVSENCGNHPPFSHVQSQSPNSNVKIPPESCNTPGTFSMAMVQEALRKTSQHVQELDKLLNK
jgi:hypothetical protein